MWKASTPSDDKIAKFKLAIEETGISQLISHDTYLVNLCHAVDETAEKSRSTLLDETLRCSMLGIRYVISHMGALLTRLREEGLGMVARQTNSILSEMPPDVTLCMETTAGQGSAINSNFEEIAILLDACHGHPALGVCLDTCHVFAAGYDIRTREAYEATVAEFDRVVGLANLKVIHLNDSKKGLGSRVDRHENIGAGMIGRDAFSFILNDSRLTEIPMVVETPTENEGHQKDLATLLQLMSSN
jgi:deoxyribonuclease-4